MRSQSKFAIGAIVSILALLTLALGYELNNKNGQLPSKGWTVGFHAYRALGYDSVPARVLGVTSQGQKGLTGVQIKNISAKTVTAVKFGWFVSEERGEGAILSKGTTPLMALAAALPPQETIDVTVPTTSLDRILKPAMRRGTLKGDFSVQVVAQEIVYEDGSVWKLPQPQNVARLTPKYAHAVDDGGGGACANQSCRWHSELQAYQCEAANGELCTNYGGSCNSSACKLTD